MNLTVDVCFFSRTNALNSKDPLSLSLLVYKLQMHIAKFKCKRGNNSHMDSLEIFCQIYPVYSLNTTSSLIEELSKQVVCKKKQCLGKY